jgi:hypothetical protein
MTIQVELAAHLVAAGIHGNRARITVCFSPIVVTKRQIRTNSVIDLENWPKQIDDLLAQLDADKGLRVRPLAAGESWRSTTFSIALQNVKLTRIRPAEDSDAINAYWQKVMRKDLGGFTHLQKALDPDAPDPLDTTLRPNKSAGNKPMTPDVHGMSRSKTVIEHSFERVRHIVGRYNGKMVTTRPLEDGAKSLTALVDKWNPGNVTPLQSRNAPRLSKARLADLSEDDQAKLALTDSIARADFFAEKRRIFQNPATSSSNAITALRAALQKWTERSPSIAAQKAGTGTGIDINEASAAYRLASRTRAATDPTPLPTVDEDVEFARRRLFTIQTNPSLGRLFRFIVDFSCDATALETAAALGCPYDDGLVLDTDASDKNLAAPETAMAEPQQANAYFLLITLGDSFKGQGMTSTVKLRPRNTGASQAGHFLPCTREEIDGRVIYPGDAKAFRDLAVAEQIDGMVDLGQSLVDGDGNKVPRYDVMTMDAVTTTAAEYNRVLTDRENQNTLNTTAVPQKIRRVFDNTEDPKNATQRSGGLVLADRWRQLHAMSRLLDSSQQRDAYSSGAVVVLDASDLTMGYKLDVGIRLKNDSVKRNRWHTLMHRHVRYAATAAAPAPFAAAGLDEYIAGLYPDATAHREAEDGQLQVPAALRDRRDDPPEPINIAVKTVAWNWTSAFTEEIIGAWRGDPLGLASGLETHYVEARDLPINIAYRLPSLGDSGHPEDLTPPPLRLGWGYHFGLRAMFSGGISMTLNRSVGHYEKHFGGDLVLPNATLPGRAYVRHERIDAPSVAVPDWLFGSLQSNKVHTEVSLRGRFPVPQAGRMMVRSFDNSDNRDTAGVSKDGKVQEKTPGVGFDRRVLLAPAVSLEFATVHDAFRGKKATDFEYKVKMCEPRVKDIDSSIDPKTEQEKPEFVPVPVDGNGNQKWDKIAVLWHSYRVESRPRGGLSGVDYRAAWGGLPIYRAALSDGIGKPKKDAEVKAPSEFITDAGEILHRTKSKGFKVFENGGEKERVVLWSSTGILPDEDAVLQRSGTSIFRPLPADRKEDVERLPYYPDPAATAMAISVTVRGKDPTKPLLVKLYDDAAPKGPVPLDYPNARPVVIDVVRGDPKNKRVSLSSNKASYSALPNAPAGLGTEISVAHVTVILSPGEEADIRCWCVPSATYLAYMCAANQNLAALAVALAISGPDKQLPAPTNAAAALVGGLKKLFVNNNKLGENSNLEFSSPDSTIYEALGGLTVPDAKSMTWLAGLLRAKLEETAIPELGAVTKIEALHAVDLPKQAPTTDLSKTPWNLLRASPSQIGFILAKNVDAQDPHKELRDPANWTQENQMPGSVNVLIDGNVSIDGPSTAAVEIHASGTAAASGRFDDVDRGRSRDDRARGLWPKPDNINYIEPKNLFGFDVSPGGKVTFAPEAVTLLRIDGLPPDTKQISLLATQRDAAALPNGSTNGSDDSPLRAQRPAAFPDARARYIKLFAVAISRHANALRTRYDELPEVLSRSSLGDDIAKLDVAAKPLTERWLPATMRPPRVSPRSPIPSFQWKDSTPFIDGAAAVDFPGKPTDATKLSSVFVRRSMRVRIRLNRPWFVSGEGERVGIVVWPPNLFGLDGNDLRNDRVDPPPADRGTVDLKKLPPDGSNLDFLQDQDLGTGGAWVTRWGADPTRELGRPQGWLLSKDNFPDVDLTLNPELVFSKPPASHPHGPVLVKNVLMPVPVEPDAAPAADAKPAGGFMAVSLVTFAPLFDPEQECWYVDVNISPCGAAYPFLRLGLVRFQPNAPRALRVSEPVVEWVQVMPERTVTAKAKLKGGKVLVEAEVQGLSSQPDPTGADTRKSTERAPRIYVSLLRRSPSQDGDQLGPEAVVATKILPEDCAAKCVTWSTAFELSQADYALKGESWSIYVEEVDRMRPARYVDEPRYETRSDDNFADTGPRFAARLSLDRLKPMPADQ